MQQFLLLCFRLWPSSFNDYAHQLTPMLRCSVLLANTLFCAFVSFFHRILCLNQTRTQGIKTKNICCLVFCSFIALLLLGAWSHTYASTNLRTKNCAFKLFITWSYCFNCYAHQLFSHLFWRRLLYDSLLNRELRVYHAQATKVKYAGSLR